MTLDIDSGCKAHLRGQENTFPVILPPSGHFWPSDSPLKIVFFYPLSFSKEKGGNPLQKVKKPQFSQNDIFRSK